MTRQSDAGFTLIELVITVMIIGVIAAIATPRLLRARMSGNEASAIAALNAVVKGQTAFAATCAQGSFADSLASLVLPPAGGGQGFISPDLSTDPTIKSGYFIAVTPGGATAPLVCSAATTTDSFAVTADPQVPGSTGVRFFFSNGDIIWQDPAPFPAVTTGPPGMGTPIR
jgi:type IV pilus assembly protein PilE